MSLLRIVPEKLLEFPFTLFSNSSVELQLENVSQHPFVAYKIKTTAPKNYLVRPSTGVVPQGAKRSVQIMLQAFSEEPPRNSSDRFLVQATPVADENPLPRNEWLSLSKTDVEETRLNVVFKRTSKTLGGPSGGPSADGEGDPSEGAPEEARSATAAEAGSSKTAELKQQYEQLIEYALAMERHKEELAKENEMLKRQLEARGSRSLAELWHFPVYLFVFVMAWYLLDRTFGGSSSKP